MHVNANFRHKVWKFRKLTSGQTRRTSYIHEGKNDDGWVMTCTNDVTSVEMHNIILSLQKWGVLTMNKKV